MTSLDTEALRSLCERLVTDSETSPLDLRRQAAAAIAGLVEERDDAVNALTCMTTANTLNESTIGHLSERATWDEAKLRAIAAYCTDPLPDTAVTHRGVAQEQAAKIYRIGQFANGEIAAIASPDAGEKK